MVPASSYRRSKRLISAWAGDPSWRGIFASTATAAHPERDLQLVRARAIAAGGRVLFDAGHYGAALAEFTRAYDVLDGHPRQWWLLHDLAVCHQRLFHYDVALELYEEYLRRAPKTEPDRDDVQQAVLTLRSLLATIAVETSVPAEVWVDHRRRGSTPGRWFVPAGVHTVELRAAGYEPERLELRLAARDTRFVRRELRRLSAISGPAPGYFWVAAGAGVASLAAGATFGVLALRSNDEGNERAELHLDTSEQSDRASKQALAADVCFGGALLFGGAATVLYFLTDWSQPGSRRESGAARVAKPVANLAVGPRRRLAFTLELEL